MIRKIRNYTDLARYQARANHILAGNFSSLEEIYEASVLTDYIIEYVDALHNGVHWQRTLKAAVTEYKSHDSNTMPLLMTITRGVDDEHPWSGCLLRINQIPHEILTGSNYYIYEALIPHINRARYRDIANVCRQLGLKFRVMDAPSSGDSTWRFGVIPLKQRLRVWKLIRSAR